MLRMCLPVRLPERIGYLLAAVCWALLGGCSSEAPAPASVEPALQTAGDAEAAVDELLQLMSKRLLLMHDVARWKWNADKPITDERRVREMLADLEERGPALRLDRI